MIILSFSCCCYFPLRKFYENDFNCWEIWTSQLFLRAKTLKCFPHLIYGFMEDDALWTGGKGWWGARDSRAISSNFKNSCLFKHIQHTGLGRAAVHFSILTSHLEFGLWSYFLGEHYDIYLSGDKSLKIFLLTCCVAPLCLGHTNY